ncbi:MAG TPA: hypothetical protein VMW83_11305 [Spirochaetia bacterium]|nr:hypothetical protein [Spirochaetia bacterium]
MKKVEKLPLSSLLLGRTHLVELILTAFLAGFSISLIASSISLLKNFNALVGIWLGLTICIISIAFITIRVIGRGHERYMFNGFFVLNEKENMILNIEEYDFAEKLNEYFVTAFNENKALEHIWISEPLKLQDELKTPEPRSINIIRESIEYFLLDSLCSHLLSHFKYPAEHKKNISILAREQISSVLLTNRFLELFSKPIEDRDSFLGVDETMNEDFEPYILEVNGTVFRKFVLVLPSNSVVQRIANNAIALKTKRFSLNLKVDFDGSNTILPNGFLENYLSILGLEDSLANVVYDVKVIISIKFKLWSILSRLGWEDYKWIDSFLGRLSKFLSKQQFFDDINWNTASTIIKCLNK